jgi:hypothetical protein
VNERIPIIYNRALRPEWIDFALDSYLGTTDEAAFRNKLIEHLRPQILGVDALRKTAGLIQRIVGFKSTIPRARLSEIHCKMMALPPDERADLRLHLLLESSPFLKDCLESMKRLALLGVNGVEIQHIYDRLSSNYGDRSTVYRCVRYVLQTLAYFGAVENRDKKWFLTSHD